MNDIKTNAIGAAVGALATAKRHGGEETFGERSRALYKELRRILSEAGLDVEAAVATIAAGETLDTTNVADCTAALLSAFERSGVHLRIAA